MHLHLFLAFGIHALAVAIILVMRNNVLAVAHLANTAAFQPDGGITQLLHVVHGVAAEHHGLLLLAELIHALHTFFLKGNVTDGQSLIYDQHIRTHHGGN